MVGIPRRITTGCCRVRESKARLRSGKGQAMKGGTAKAICALSALPYLYGMPQTGIGCVFDTVKTLDAARAGRTEFERIRLGLRASRWVRCPDGATNVLPVRVRPGCRPDRCGRFRF